MSKAEKKVGGRTFTIKLSKSGQQHAALAQSHQSALEACVEANTKCGKCSGLVRAQCMDSQDGNNLTCDLEIKVSIYCRDAVCGWQSMQWRPWRAAAPKEL